MESIYSTLLTLHSYWAFLTLLVLLLASLNAISGYFGNKEFVMGKDLRISLFGLIFTHIQLLLGLILYFVSPYFQMWSEGGVMANPIARLILVEHPLTNIIAVALITIGWSKHKKQTTSKGKFGKIALFYILGLLLLLSRIPYTNWFN